MKKLVVIALVTSALAFQSCGGFKYGDTVKQPCKEIVNPKKFVRGEGQWTQLDPGAASTGAVRQARIALAASLGTKVKEVATSYSKDVQISGNLQLDQKCLWVFLFCIQYCCLCFLKNMVGQIGNKNCLGKLKFQ